MLRPGQGADANTSVFKTLGALLTTLPAMPLPSLQDCWGGVFLLSRQLEHQSDDMGFLWCVPGFPAQCS